MSPFTIALKPKPKQYTQTEQSYYQTINRLKYLEQQYSECPQEQVDEIAYQIRAENEKLERIMNELNPKREDKKKQLEALLIEWHKAELSA